MTTTPAERTYAEAHPGWLPYRIEVHGADHEGIIHEVAHYLSGHGISIESVDSESTPAPTSGVPLFAMTAQVVVPPGLAGPGWEAGLEEIGGPHEPGHPGVRLAGSSGRPGLTDGRTIPTPEFVARDSPDESPPATVRLTQT